ncbi:MAG: nucleotide exchange factor GrpE [Myxococcota bacterium]
MSKDQPRSALDEAMAEALESVEKRERESKGSADAGVEVEVPEEADESDAAEPEQAPAAPEASELQDKLLRLAADFDNYRKRSRRELDDARKYGIESLLRDILPVLDNFERALAATSEDDDHPLVQGIRMVMKQFQDILSQHGVKAFDSLGEIFDPELHEALSQLQTNDHEAGTILNEHERGYRIHERLLRPARVVVAMPPPEPEPAEQSDAEAETASEGEEE